VYQNNLLYLCFMVVLEERDILHKKQFWGIGVRWC